MEKRGGHTMVNGNLALKQQNESNIDSVFMPDPLKYTSVSLTEVFANNTRFDASAFNLDAKAAKYKVTHCKYGYSYLWGLNGLVKDAFYPGRFKRIYVEKDIKDAVPFYLPSQLTEIYPKPTKYISIKTYKAIGNLDIVPDNLLLSRSGTIGKCSISSKTIIGNCYSDDVIRVSFNGKYDVGYVYAFFNTKKGQLILQTNNYGAVVQHIEPDHLRSIVIPNAPEEIKKQIHNLVMVSYDLRDQSNALLDEAEKILYQELQLPPIEELQPEYYDESIDLRNFTTKLSRLNLRLDGSYHTPELARMRDIVERNCRESIPLENRKLTKSIFTGNRFTRVYVEEKNGIPYLSGKHLLELNPGGNNKKYLSFAKHQKRIEEQLIIKENTILVTCSGTIGKVAIVPKHWVGWAGTHDLIRVEFSDADKIGYIFCYLNSDYGQRALKSLIYGSVVDHIEASHISKVEIPILKNESKQKEINDKVLQANELRYQAYLKEQEAIQKMEDVMS